MIKIENLSKSFSGREVLKDINLTIPSNKSLVILGTSGTGKSVLIKSIAGIIVIDSGKIFLDEKRIDDANFDNKLKMMSIFGFLFQYSALFDSLNVLDNITFYVAQKYNMTKDAKIILASELLEQVELNKDILYMFPSELSGGMQKRVGLARAIAAKPRYMLLDEPVTGLDPITSRAIDELILKLIKTYSLTSITITHSIESAKLIADNIVYMANKTIQWQGTKDEFFNSGHQNEEVNRFVNSYSIDFKTNNHPS